MHSSPASATLSQSFLVAIMQSELWNQPINQNAILKTVAAAASACHMRQQMAGGAQYSEHVNVGLSSNVSPLWPGPATFPFGLSKAHTLLTFWPASWQLISISQILATCHLLFAICYMPHVPPPPGSILHNRRAKCEPCRTMPVNKPQKASLLSCRRPLAFLLTCHAHAQRPSGFRAQIRASEWPLRRFVTLYLVHLNVQHTQHSRVASPGYQVSV